MSILVKGRCALTADVAINRIEAQPARFHGDPVTVSIKESVRISGISRSEIYRRLKAKKLRAVKSGKHTLILMESLRQHLASLPPAEFSE